MAVWLNGCMTGGGVLVNHLKYQLNSGHRRRHTVLDTCLLSQYSSNTVHCPTQWWWHQLMKSANYEEKIGYIFHNIYRNSLVAIILAYWLISHSEASNTALQVKDGKTSMFCALIVWYSIGQPNTAKYCILCCHDELKKSRIALSDFTLFLPCRALFPFFTVSLFKRFTTPKRWKWKDILCYVWYRVF